MAIGFQDLHNSALERGIFRVLEMAAVGIHEVSTRTVSSAMSDCELSESELDSAMLPLALSESSASTVFRA